MTEVRIDTFKGSDVFAIWDTSKDDSEAANYPIISFGVKKAKAIVAHYDELVQFIRRQETLEQTAKKVVTNVPKKSSKKASTAKKSTKAAASTNASTDTATVKLVPKITKKIS